MSDFKIVMNEKTRMCKQIGVCDKCPLSVRRNKANVFCDTFMREHPEEADNIIMQWSKEHPVVTNAMKFKEVFGYDFQDAFGALGCSEWLDDEYEKGKQYE